MTQRGQARELLGPHTPDYGAHAAQRFVDHLAPAFLVEAAYCLRIAGDERRRCQQSRAAQSRLEQGHLRRRLTFPDHPFANHTDRSCCSMKRSQADRCKALHGGQTAPIFVTGHQIACFAGEWTVDGTGHSLPSEASPEGAGLLLDVGDQRLQRRQAATSQQRLPGQERSLNAIPRRRGIAVDHRAGQTPQPGKQSRLRLRLDVGEVVGSPAGRIDPPGTAHQHAGDVLVEDQRLIAPDKLASGSLVVQPPGEARRVRQWIRDDTDPVIVRLQRGANAQAARISRIT